MTETSDAASSPGDAARDAADSSPDNEHAGGQSSSETDSNERSQPPQSEAPPAATDAGPPPTEAEEELPEWEPLTPELVEDEAIRGDVMLRVAVVSLAFLFACTEIRESATLVHIRAGQYMAENGVLPPRHDVFSYTAGDRTWVNLAWLFDLFVAGAYSLGEFVIDGYGAVVLSLVKAIVAAIAFWFVAHTTRRDLSTWWGSIAAGIALVVCYPQFTAAPELVTLLGLALLLWILNRWHETSRDRVPWILAGVILVWANLDPRMFFGLALLLLYALGHSVGRLLGRPGHVDRDACKRLWQATAACFAAALVNPFLWSSLTAAWTLYGIEYPEFRAYYTRAVSVEQLQYYPMVSGAFWTQLNHHSVAGLLLVAAAVVSLALNFERTDFGHLFVFAGFVGFAMAGSHELAALSLIAAVQTSLNAQDWYRSNFRQTYSVDTSELLFSRGGRAATVLAFFAFAYLAVSGRLSGADGRRTGVGFHTELETAINGLADDLKDSYDDRPFHLSLEQGDHLIWVGRSPDNRQRVFVDSRLPLYAGDGEGDLLELHRKTRLALRSANPDQPDTGKPDVWKATFDRFQVTHVLPRLHGLFPDYLTFLDLRNSPDWQLARVGASTAVFYRTDLEDEQLAEYRQAHRVNFVDEVFHAESEEDKVVTRPDWARPPSAYRYLSLPETVQSNAIQQSRHYQMQYLNAAMDSRVIVAPPVGMAMAYLTIQKANEGLSLDPQNATGYRLLGSAYEYLRAMETRVAREGGGSIANLQRFYQAVQAYNQSLTIEPENAAVHLSLMGLYRSEQKVDLALRELDAYDELMARQPNLNDLEQRIQDRNAQLREGLTNHTTQVETQIDQMLSQPAANPLGIAQIAYQNGCSLLAERILEDHLNLVNQSLQAQLLRAVILIETGQSEQATQLLYMLQSRAQQAPQLNWRRAAAAVALGSADYDRAMNLLNEEIDELKLRHVSTLLQTTPLAEGPSQWLMGQTAAAVNVLLQLPEQVAELQYEIALAALEKGQSRESAEALQKLLDENPDSDLRAIARFYLFHMTGEAIDPFGPNERIPITSDLFAAGDEPEPPTEAVPEEAAPEEAAPEDAVPEDAVPEEAASEEEAP